MLTRITEEERDEVRREALMRAVAVVRRETLMRAVAIVQRYENENWRRLRVNDICTEIKRRLKEEAGS